MDGNTVEKVLAQFLQLTGENATFLLCVGGGTRAFDHCGRLIIIIINKYEQLVILNIFL